LLDWGANARIPAEAKYSSVFQCPDRLRGTHLLLTNEDRTSVS
jgi:hypothetical protein